MFDGIRILSYIICRLVVSFNLFRLNIPSIISDNRVYIYAV